MLENLDNIDWSQLTHAYGSAEDVPVLIQTIAYGNDGEKKEAWYELYGNIWHQGTVYEATVQAVPFFIEIARDDTRSDLFEVLGFLALVAHGILYLDRYQENGIASPWVIPTNDAVSSGLSMYLEYLYHQNARVRDVCADLASLFPSKDTEILSFLIKRFNKFETDASARASCVLSLGIIANRNDVQLDFLNKAFSTLEPEAVRIASAFGLAWTKRQSATPSIHQFINALDEDMLETAFAVRSRDIIPDLLEYLETAKLALRSVVHKKP